jgi:hypothetical protein
MGNATNWVVEKLKKQERYKVLDRTQEDFLILTADDGYTFVVAVLGVQNVIQLSDVQPLFAGATKPQLVVNVPSKSMWSGAAIDFIHDVPAAFGTFGDIFRAAETRAAESYRDKGMGFFINAIEQHTNVSSVSYVYDTVFRADRWDGTSIVVAVIDAYDMSAEDVRNARSRLGHFDVIVKSSSYGSITEQAEAAAQSMGAQALKFRELMQRLAK